MFEAKLLDGSILKRIVEAIKDVVNDVNIDVSPSGKSSFTPTIRPDPANTCPGSQKWHGYISGHVRSLFARI